MKKKNKSFGEAVAVGSALAGAALGAAAVVLSDKKNQQKLKKTIDGLSHDAVQLGRDIKKKADEFRKPAKPTATVKPASTVKKTIKKTIKKSSPKIPATPVKK